MIKFEIEHALKPKEEPEKDKGLNESDSATKLLQMDEPHHEEYLDDDYDVEHQDEEEEENPDDEMGDIDQLRE